MDVCLVYDKGNEPYRKEGKRCTVKGEIGNSELSLTWGCRGSFSIRKRNVKFRSNKYVENLIKV